MKKSRLHQLITNLQTNKNGKSRETVTSTRGDPRDKYGRSNRQRPSREPER